MVKSPLKSTMQILPYMKKAMFRLQGHKEWKFRNSTKVKALFSHKPAHWKHLLNLFSVFCTIRNVWRENQFELFPFQRTRAHCSKKHFFSATLADQHNSAIISELCWCLEQEVRTVKCQQYWQLKTNIFLFSAIKQPQFKGLDWPCIHTHGFQRQSEKWSFCKQSHSRMTPIFT